MNISLFTGIFSELPLLEIIPVAGKIGYDAMEIRVISHLPSDIPDEDLGRIKEKLEEHKLKVSLLYTPLGRYTQKNDEECKRELEKFKRYLTLGEKLGVKLYLQLEGGPSPEEAKEEDYRRAAKWVKEAAKLAQDFEAKVCMETHFGGLVENPDSAIKLLEMIGEDNAGIIYDASNLYISQADWGEKGIKKLGERIFHFHVKDMKMVKPDTPGAVKIKGYFYVHTLLGEGDVDHRICFKALKDIGYEEYLSCECHLKIDPYLRAEHEYKKVKELLDKIKGGE